jgi:uncharacterized protein (TIGR00645 family)
MHHVLDKAVLASRWLASIFLLGLTLALVIFAWRFARRIQGFAQDAATGDDTLMLISLLHLLDWTLVASLVVTVVIASWDSLVSPLEIGDEPGGISRIGKIDPGNLKVKLAGSIVAISSVQLLQVALQSEAYSDRTITWAMSLHLLFLLSAIVLALTDRIAMAGSDRHRA